MSRKHFQMIADVVAKTHGISPADRRALAISFAVELSKTNERFDSSRFIKACTA